MKGQVDELIKATHWCMLQIAMECLGILSHTAIQKLNELSCFYMTYLYNIIHYTFICLSMCKSCTDLRLVLLVLCRGSHMQAKLERDVCRHEGHHVE